MSMGATPRPPFNPLTLDAAYAYVVSWTEFPIVPSYPHYPQPQPSQEAGRRVRFGFRASGVGLWVSGFGFRVSGFGFRVSGFGFRGSGFGFRVSGFEFRVSDFGFRIPDVG